MWCSRSFVRMWKAGLVTVIFFGAMRQTPRGGDGPSAGPSPPAENILDEVARQNSERFARPPSPMRPEKVVRFSPRNLKVQSKSRSEVRVKLPEKQALLTPAVADGKVFVGGGFGSQEFYCLAADTGRPIWGVRLSDNGPSAPAYDPAR